MLERFLKYAPLWTALAALFNAVAVSLTPPMAPALQAAINGLILVIGSFFVGQMVVGEVKTGIAERKLREFREVDIPAMAPDTEQDNGMRYRG